MLIHLYCLIRKKRPGQNNLMFPRCFVPASLSSMTIFIFFPAAAWTWVIAANILCFYKWLTCFFLFSLFAPGNRLGIFHYFLTLQVIANFRFHNISSYFFFNTFYHGFKHGEAFHLIFAQWIILSVST